MTAKEYFEQLATEHTLVKHSAAEPHFGCSLDDASTLMARRLYYPAVFLAEGDMVVNGSAGNELLNREYSLVFATHVKDSGNETEKASAFDLTETLLRDFLGRMFRDRQKGVSPMVRFSPLGSSAYRVELSEAGLYGWILTFSLSINLSKLNCNQNFES